MVRPARKRSGSRLVECRGSNCVNSCHTFCLIELVIRDVHQHIAGFCDCYLGRVIDNRILSIVADVGDSFSSKVEVRKIPSDLGSPPDVCHMAKTIFVSVSIRNDYTGNFRISIDSLCSGKRYFDISMACPDCHFTSNACYCRRTSADCAEASVFVKRLIYGRLAVKNIICIARRLEQSILACVCCCGRCSAVRYCYFYTAFIRDLCAGFEC